MNKIIDKACLEPLNVGTKDDGILTFHYYKNEQEVIVNYGDTVQFYDANGNVRSSILKAKPTGIRTTL